VPAQNYRPNGLPEFPALPPWYYEDVVLEVSPGGEIRREISVLKALAENRGLFAITYSEGHTITTQDPLHLNNVEPLPAGMAAAFPMFRPGDLLVSLRNIDTIAVIDPATERVKWTMTGPFARQHDSDFLPNGHLMVYDNWGGPPACGGSRVLELDPATRSVVWQYDGCGTHPFFGETRGEQEVLSNGNALTFEPQGGRILEVTREAKPEIVWEYFNVLDPAAGGKRVGLITHAERFPPGSLTFLTPASS
jgi:Arylsulfotransferase (ASST)